MQRPNLFSRLATLAGFGARRFPGFLCIGAQRGGTTWLHANLAGHPGCWLPPAKEMHYFDQVHDVESGRWAPARRAYLDGLASVLAARHAQGTLSKADRELRRWAAHYADSGLVDDDWYAGLFAAAPRRALVGDITPAYALLDDAGVAHVARLMPEARLFFMLRQPAERMLSGAWHELMLDRRDPAPPTFAELRAELKSERCRGRSRYHRTIAIWSRHFPADQFKVLFHDDVVSRPQAVLREVCAHLGIAYAPALFPSGSEPVNAGREMPAEYRREGLRLATESCRDELEGLSAVVGPLPAGWSRTAKGRDGPSA